jgi:hypothetical protein
MEKNLQDKKTKTLFLPFFWHNYFPSPALAEVASCRPMAIGLTWAPAACTLAFCSRRDQALSSHCPINIPLINTAPE